MAESGHFRALLIYSLIEDASSKYDDASSFNLEMSQTEKSRLHRIGFISIYIYYMFVIILMYSIILQMVQGDEVVNSAGVSTLSQPCLAFSVGFIIYIFPILRVGSEENGTGLPFRPISLFKRFEIVIAFSPNFPSPLSNTNEKSDK